MISITVLTGCLTHAGRRVPSRYYFPELLENAQSQRAELPAMQLYIESGPVDILKKKKSVLVRSLTYDVILQPLHGPKWWNWSITLEPSVVESRIKHQMTRNEEPVRILCNFTYLHDCVCMIACLYATLFPRSLTRPQRSTVYRRPYIWLSLSSSRHARHARFFPRRSSSIRSETARGVVSPFGREGRKNRSVWRGLTYAS